MVAVPVAFLLILTSAAALPQPSKSDFELQEARLVTGSIVNAIKELSKQIQDAGLDPLIIENAEEQYEVSEYLELNVFVESLKLTGLSNIAINIMDYSVLTNRLRFDISLPEIYLSIGNSSVSVSAFTRQLLGNMNGQVIIKNLRLTGNIRLNVSIISGISVRSLSLDFSLGGIDSQLKLLIQDQDQSDIINTVLSVTIPEYIEKNREQINKALEMIAWEIIASLS